MIKELQKIFDDGITIKDSDGVSAYYPKNSDYTTRMMVKVFMEKAFEEGMKYAKQKPSAVLERRGEQ